MRRLPVLLGIVFLTNAPLARPVIANDFFVFPVKMSLPVRVVSAGAIVKTTLKEKDVVNLALGRPLGTKVDKKREILAYSAARYPEDAPDARLIVFDPSQNGLAQVTTIVAEPTAIDHELAVLANGTAGHGVVTGAVHETTLGDPAHDALHATTIWISGSGKEVNHKGSAKGIVAGRVSFTNTANGQTVTRTGFIAGGKIMLPVKLIGMYSDGDTGPTGCGDGIIEAGEECEFNHQEACPGHCNGCVCIVCGNNRIDPGEICDHTALGVCAELVTGTGCKADCSGCEVCGDGVVAPNEECDPAAQNQCPGSSCLSPECKCGCVPGMAGTCPTGNECCDSVTHRCCVPGSDGCFIHLEECCGGTVGQGLCNGLVAPGAPCPTTPPNTCFACNTCDGKNVTGSCTISFDSVCTLDPP